MYEYCFLFLLSYITQKMFVKYAYGLYLLEYVKHGKPKIHIHY